ncbi:hypothetical protein EAY32_20345, partial [Vibrio anguillarum]|nr:hypothetical protein [Vibrio anguillarum]
VQSNYNDTDDPDEHMESMFESLNTLKDKFSENEDAVKIIERELELVNEWVAESAVPEPKISPRSFGTVTPPEEKYGTRSIFEDIDDGQ